MTVTSTNANTVVGKALRDLRIKAGLTQQQVAGKLSEPQSFVSKVETAERSLKLWEVFPYANALGVDPSELVSTVEGILSVTTGIEA